MWPNTKFPADLVIFTEEILNGKLHFCAVKSAGITAALILSTWNGEEAELTTKPPTDFELEAPGLGIQCSNN